MFILSKLCLNSAFMLQWCGLCVRTVKPLYFVALSFQDFVHEFLHYHNLKPCATVITLDQTSELVRFVNFYYFCM